MLSSISAVISDKAYAVWLDPDWGFRQMISINSSQVPGDLTNFPVLVSVTDPNLRVMPSGSVGKTNGGDILFTLADGKTQLDHEIESYNPVTGEIVAWVEVPNVSSTIDTVIYMYYGNAGAPDQWNVNATWDEGGANNFLTVQHLNESPADGVSGHIDSSPLSPPEKTVPYNFMPLNFQDGGGGTTDAPGKIGGADFFAGDDDYLIESNSISPPVRDYDSIFLIDFYPSAWTFSAWFKTSSSNKTLYMEARNANVGFVTMQITGTGAFHSRGHCDNWTNLFQNGPFNGFDTNATGLNDNTWRHVAIANNNGNMNVYVDGSLDKSITYTVVTPFLPPPNWCQSLFMLNTTIGAWRRNDLGSFWNGSIDEVRISKTQRSADWIEASYNNQNNPSSFLRFSAQAEFIPAPTMNEWGMIIFMILAGVGAVYYLKREKRV